ncbi:cadherin-like domain-containing protein [Chloroflexi bacterium TSY]|nr:cadherin-like domain-containing protein [Chloroflexi bacterium TSY]
MPESTESATHTPSNTPSKTPVPSDTPSRTRTATSESTHTPSNTATEEATNTPTPKPTDSATPQSTDTSAPTATATRFELVNKPPVLFEDVVTTKEDQSIHINVLANDEDPDQDELTVVWTGGASNGTAELDGQSILYEPNADYHGGDTFEYTVTDGEHTVSSKARVTIQSVNDAPHAVSDSVELREDTTLEIDVLANDSDIENDSLKILSVSLSLARTWYCPNSE